MTNDFVTCGGGPPGDPNGEKTALLLEFANFLHTLPPEDGFDVGPARVKFDAHGATEKVLWATQEDTARWVRAFLAAPRGPASGCKTPAGCRENGCLGWCDEHRPDGAAVPDSKTPNAELSGAPAQEQR